MCAQRLVLGGEDALDGAHERAALARQVGVDLAFEVGLEEITRTDADAEGHHALEGVSRRILEDGETRIETASFEEHPPQRGARSLGGDQDHVHVGRRDDARALLVGDAEPVREVECLAGREVFAERGPHGDLACVGEQVLDDRAALGRLLDAEERLPRYPAVGDGPFPTAGALALAYDDVEAVVAQVERLSGALYAVADDGDRLVFEDFACLLQWKLFAGDDGFVYTAEIDLCHSRNCFL